MDMHRRCARLVERYGNGDLDRRSFLGAVGIAALGAGISGSGLLGFARHAQAATRSLRFDGWGGTWQEGINRLVFNPFTAKTGIKMREGSYGSVEEFLTTLRAGSPGDYNLCSLTTQLAYKQYCDFGFGAELDATKIPRLALVDQRAVDGFRKLSGGVLSAVPYILTTIGILYSTKALSADAVKKADVNILLDPSLKGKISGENNYLKRIWYAALQTGQNPNAIKDMDAIWDKIRQSRGLVVKYWASGAEQMSLIANGTAVVMDGWGVRAFALKKQNLPVDIYFPKGIYTDLGGLFVIKGTPLDAAYEALDFLLTPEVQFAMAEEEGNTPLFDPKKIDVPLDIRRTLPGYDENGVLRLDTFADPVYWSQNSLAWQKKYQEVMARG